MNIVAKGSLVAGAAIVFACSSGLVAAGTQAPPNRGASVSSAPDITGSWERFGGGAVGRGQGTDPRTPPPTPPPPLKPQFLKAWQDRQQAARAATAKGQPIGINWVNCLPDGMPGMMQGPFPLEILQSRGQVTIIQESFTQVRRILLDRPQKPLDEVDPTFYGNSVGRWVGDTLVVDTLGIKEGVQYQNVPHSAQMRITERFRLVQPDVLWDEITIEDPVTLEKPWTFTFAYRRMPDYTLLEYICEDNREYIDDKGLQRMRLDPPARR